MPTELHAFLSALLTSMESWALPMAVVASSFWFPLVLTLHVLAMATLVGCIAVVDFRLLGLVAKHVSVERFSADILPLTWIAFTLAIITGVTLFPPQALRYAANPMFQAKMLFLIAAGINMLVFHRMTRAGAQASPSHVRIAGALSLLFWIGVLICGRFIPYFGENSF